MANSVGGFKTRGAMDGDTVFEHVQSGLDRSGHGPYVSVLKALSSDGTQTKGTFARPMSALAGGLSVANGVVFPVSIADEDLTSPPQTPEWALYELDASNGAVLARLTRPRRALSGPVISRGRIYAGFGNSAVA